LKILLFFTVSVIYLIVIA